MYVCVCVCVHECGARRRRCSDDDTGPSSDETGAAAADGSGTVSGDEGVCTLESN